MRWPDNQRRNGRPHRAHRRPMCGVRRSGLATKGGRTSQCAGLSSFRGWASRDGFLRRCGFSTVPSLGCALTPALASETKNRNLRHPIARHRAMRLLPGEPGQQAFAGEPIRNPHERATAGVCVRAAPQRHQSADAQHRPRHDPRRSRRRRRTTPHSPPDIVKATDWQMWTQYAPSPIRRKIWLV